MLIPKLYYKVLCHHDKKKCQEDANMLYLLKVQHTWTYIGLGHDSGEVSRSRFDLPVDCTFVGYHFRWDRIWEARNESGDLKPDSLSEIMKPNNFYTFSIITSIYSATIVVI